MSQNANQSRNETVVSFDDIKKKKLKPCHIQKFAEPLTDNHRTILDDYDDGKFLMLTGCPGTGKTFMLLNKSLQLVLESNEFRHIIIVRSIVPVRDVGFLKGDKEEKCQEYEKPYVQIVNETFSSKGVELYEKLKQDGILEFQPTSFNQGITLHNSLIIVDEAQNMNYGELYNITTRVGENSRIYFAGDYKKQNMLVKSNKDTSGLAQLINVIKSSDELKDGFKTHELTPDDIVRSPFVKAFVTADYEYKS
jgi:predicted ribonuclease YlaK